MKENRLLKKTGLYFIGNLSSKLVSVLLVPIYAFFVKASDLGTYDYSNTLIMIAVPVFFCAIWEAILKFLLSNKNVPKEQVIMSSACFVLIMGFCVTSITLAINHFFPIPVGYLTLTVLMMISYGFAFVWQYYARGLAKNQIYVAAGILGALVNFALNVLFLCVLHLGIISLFWAFIASQATIVVFIELKLKILSSNFKTNNFSGPVLKSMLIFSAPLVLNSVSMWLISGFGRTIIIANLGVTANGLYAFANKFGIIISTLGTIISMALIEESILLSNEKGFDEYFSKIIQRLFRLFQSILLLALPAIAVFYRLIASTTYFPSIDYFPLFLLYAVFITMSTNIASIMQATNKTNLIFYTTLIGGILTVGISMAFVKTIGIYAVALGQLIGALAMLISRYLLINRFAKIRLEFGNMFLLLALYVIFTVVAIKAGMLLNIIAFAIAAALTTILNYKDLRIIIGQLSQRMRRGNAHE